MHSTSGSSGAGRLTVTTPPVSSCSIRKRSFAALESGCQAWSVEFRNQARRLALTQGVDDRKLRDAADAHIQMAHPDLDD